jgi:tetratricopeptide (TPR) repeat protein
MKKIIVTLIVMAAAAAGLLAQAPAAKNWKDRAEYDLYDSITKEAMPAARLASLDKWKSGYPQSDYADVRLKAYLITYQQMNNHRAAFDTATEILKADPTDQASIQEILGFLRALMPTQANAALSAQNRSDLDTAEKTARYLLANADAVYGAAKKPQGVTDEVWAKTKPTMVNFAQFTLGYIGATEKDTAKAEAELVKTVQMDPTNAQASYMLAGVLLAQQKEHPDKMPLAIFEYARAATYDGAGSMDANTRKQIDTFLGKAYNTYHGSAAGLDQIKTQAKTNALPPGGFELKSVVEIAKAEEEKRQAEAAANPMLAFWKEIKEGLTGDGSATYWDAMKDAGLPGGHNGVNKFKGKLVSATPETKPKELTIAVGGDMPDVTIKLDEPLPGKMDPGGEISFSGAAKEFTKEPFMVTFESAPDDIEGWTGKGPAGAARPAGATKKTPAKKQ